MMAGADLLVHNARVWTDGATQPDADAIAVGGGVILGVGRDADLHVWTGPHTRRVDACGASVTPGLCDAHLHLVDFALARREVRLEGLPSRAAVIAAIEERLRESPGRGPIVGRGWSAESWAEPPDRAVLDRIGGDRPVLLHSKDFHALWVNGAALRAAGVSRETPDPPGGRFERDANGEPTGIVKEHAVRAFRHLLPEPAPETLLEEVRTAARMLHAEGITAIHDFEGERERPVLRALASGPGTRLRVLAHLAHAELEAALRDGVASGEGDLWFRTGGVKLFADGTLGSRTAALLAPYDGTDESGMELIAPDELKVLVGRAHAGGLAVAIHAIGDRAVRSSLDAFEASARAGSAARAALPSRIEHVQLLDPGDLSRFASLGIAASMQPSHCTADAELADRWWASRRDHSYPWRGLLESGALLAFGSDAPVEPPVAREGIHAAVTRTRPGAAPASDARQCLGLDQALTAYTEAPARLAGAWPRLGRLAAGAEADLVVWSEDLHATSPDRLFDVRPALTVLAGEIVHHRDEPHRRDSAGLAAGAMEAR
jgi:predicted amidohydrolase YtcJ